MFRDGKPSNPIGSYFELEESQQGLGGCDSLPTLVVRECTGLCGAKVDAKAQRRQVDEVTCGSLSHSFLGASRASPSSMLVAIRVEDD